MPTHHIQLPAEAYLRIRHAVEWVATAPDNAPLDAMVTIRETLETFCVEEASKHGSKLSGFYIDKEGFLVAKDSYGMEIYVFGERA